MTLYQLANLAILYSANILIASRFGPAAVTQYAVPYALFAALTSTAWLVVSPYLPAYADAKARRDLDWIRHRAIRALGITIIFVALGGLALIVGGPKAIRTLTGSHVKPQTSLLVGLACFCVLKALSNTNSVAWVGLGLVRIGASVYVIVATVYMLGTWLLLPLMGIIAVPIAGILAHLLDAFISIPYVLWHLRAEYSDSQQDPAIARLRNPTLQISD